MLAKVYNYAGNGVKILCEPIIIRILNKNQYLTLICTLNFFSSEHDETTFPRQVAKSYLNIENFKNLPWEQNDFQQRRILMETLIYD